MNSQNQFLPYSQEIIHSRKRIWRKQQRTEHLQRHETHKQEHAERSSGWIGGAILILLGLVFLMQNIRFQYFENLWALLFLIPAYTAYTIAWHCYKQNGKIAHGTVITLIIGIFFSVISLVFLFDLTVDLLCPILIVASGFVLLLKILV